MKDINNIKDVWHKLMYILTPQQKKYGAILFVLSLVGALLETLGVSIIIPFMQAMVEPQKLMRNIYVARLMKHLGINSNIGLTFLICIVIAGVYILKNIFLTALSWFRAKYSCKVVREISTKVMRSYMGRSYSFFLTTNMGDLVRGTASDTNGVYSIIYSGFRIIAELLTVFFIFVYVLLTDAAMAICIMILGIICMFIVQAYFRNKMKILGKLSRTYNASLNKYMYQAYQGIKEVIVMQRQNFFVRNYEQAYIDVQKASVGLTVATESPAYAIEAICVVGIIMVLGFRVSSMEDATSYIPKLASFALAAFRIMPSLGRITSSSNSFIYSCPSLTATYNNFRDLSAAEEMCAQHSDPELEKKYENGGFMREIQMDHITWKYKDAENAVINDLSMDIPKGQCVGIIGTSGAGKSTLMDIILGLFQPQRGEVSVDGADIRKIPHAWARMIGYVPQSVYLTDDTIRNNVAFGLQEKEIDDQKIWKALSAAHINQFIEELPDGLDTIVGERGIRFSGGQRQRIAIARALYFDPDIIIFDEATSALDNETEAAVMESIDALHGTKTMIIVAHRLTTIKNCDAVYEIVDGKAKKAEEK